jgi:hypothetical protein
MDQKPRRRLHQPGSMSQQSKGKTRLNNANSVDADHADCHGSGQILAWRTLLPALDSPPWDAFEVGGLPV